MRTVLTRLVIAFALLAMGAFAADNSIGTWKLNLDMSKFSPSTPVKALTTVREAWDHGVKATTTGERTGGTPINSSYSAKYDGKEYSVTGAPYDTIILKQVNADTYTFTQKKKDGKYSVTGRSVVSKDGKTMTHTFNGTNADGNPYRATMVWQKQ